MKVLIAYATSEGQTEKIARFIGQDLSSSGHEITYHNVKQLSGGLSVSEFDKAIIAGSVHFGKHQEELDLFAFANRETLNQMSTLFISVSLAVAFPDSEDHAAGYVDTFHESTGWKPTRDLLVAGAMRHGAYAWFEESKLMEGDLQSHINQELKEDQEFTDWEQLKESVRNFVLS